MELLYHRFPLSRYHLRERHSPSARSPSITSLCVTVCARCKRRHPIVTVDAIFSLLSSFFFFLLIPLSHSFGNKRDRLETLTRTVCYLHSDIAFVRKSDLRKTERSAILTRHPRLQVCNFSCAKWSVVLLSTLNATSSSGATRRNGSTDACTGALCSKVMLVKSIYILNVVVKQASLIRTQENKTGDVLSCYIQKSSIHYTLLYIHSRVRIYRIIKVDNLKIIHKK